MGNVETDGVIPGLCVTPDATILGRREDPESELLEGGLGNGGDIRRFPEGQRSFAVPIAGSEAPSVLHYGVAQIFVPETNKPQHS